MQPSSGRARTQEFAALVDENIDALYNFALHQVRDPADAEDLAQEACLRAYRHFHRFEPGTNFKAWVFRILRNLAINRHRKSARRGGRVALEAVDHVLEAKGTGPVADGDWPFSREEVRGALDRLPPRHREAILLHCVEGFTYAEIAGITSVPIGTVMSRIFRARRKLRDMLTDDASPAPPRVVDGSLRPARAVS